MLRSQQAVQIDHLKRQLVALRHSQPRRWQSNHRSLARGLIWQRLKQAWRFQRGRFPNFPGRTESALSPRRNRFVLASPHALQKIHRLQVGEVGAKRRG